MQFNGEKRQLVGKHENKNGQEPLGQGHRIEFLSHNISMT